MHQTDTNTNTGPNPTNTLAARALARPFPGKTGEQKTLGSEAVGHLDE